MISQCTRFWLVVTLTLAVAAMGCLDAARACADDAPASVPTKPAKPADSGDEGGEGDATPTMDLGDQPVLLLDRAAKSARVECVPETSSRLIAVRPIPWALHEPLPAFPSDDDRQDAWKPTRCAGRCYQPHAPPIVA